MTGKNAHLMLGDCLERMSEIEDNSVDMVCADLPYGTTACTWDSIIPLEPLWAHYKRVCKPNAAIILTAAQPFTSALISSNPRWFKYEWIWSKNKSTNFLNSKRQPLRSHESVLAFYDKQCTYNPQKTTGHKPVNSYTKHTSDGSTVRSTQKGFSGGGSTERFPTSVLEFAVVNQDGSSDVGNFHPSQKPLALIEYLLSTYSNPGDVVLDNTMGSGTCGVAAINLGRKFIGVEKDEDYFERAKSRLKRQTSP